MLFRSADFGRTQRQRNVVESIFKEVKTMPMTKWITLAEEILPYISTDLTNDQIMSYMTSVITMGTTEINQMRIPVDNGYSNQTIRKMQVLVIDKELNKEELHKFIFEED